MNIPALVATLLLAVLALPCKTLAQAPAGTDPKRVSTDPDYGYTMAKAIKVGYKDGQDGPRAEREYFSLLRDEKGRSVQFSRIGSFGGGPDGHILDGYTIVTSTGREVTLYIDMYHPECDPKKQPAPKGFWMAK